MDNKDLIKYLKQKKTYSFSALKEKLKLINDDDLLFEILNLMKKSIENINFETNTECNKYLIECCRYINYSQGKIDIHNKENISHLIEKIYFIINKKIVKQFKCEKTHKTIMTSRLLLKIQEELKYAYKKYSGKKDFEKNLENNDLEAFVRYLIYEIKDIECIKSFFKILPQAASLDENNIFNEIFDNYMNLMINSKDNNELIYYRKLLFIYLDISKQQGYNYETYTIKKLYSILNKIDENESDLRYVVNKDLNYIENKENIKVNENICEIIKILYPKQIANKNLLSFQKHRYKKIDKTIITLDTDVAKNFENAISIEIDENNNYHLGIYISNVLDNLIYLLNYDVESFKYLLKMNLRTFLLKYVNNKNKLLNLNLVENTNKAVIAYDIVVDNTGKVIDIFSKRAIINVAENIKYSSVLSRMRKNDHVGDTLKALNAFNNAFISHVDINNLDSPEVFGKCLNRNLMEFFGEEVANYCHEKKLPFIYTVYDRKGNLDKIYNYKKEIDEPYLKRIIDTILPEQKGTVYDIYAPNNIYGNVSRPVRDYPALINQILTAYYLSNKNEISYENIIRIRDILNNFCSNLKTEEKNIDDIENEYVKIIKKKAIDK